MQSVVRVTKERTIQNVVPSSIFRLIILKLWVPVEIVAAMCPSPPFPHFKSKTHYDVQIGFVSTAAAPETSRGRAEITFVE